MKHWSGLVQNTEDDNRGLFHTVCNRILKTDKRTWNPMTVTCPKCLNSVAVKGLIAEFMAERIENGVDPERYGAYFHIMGVNPDSRGGI